MKIDLVLLGRNTKPVEWICGDVLPVSASVAGIEEAVHHYNDKAGHEWILFWDERFALPEIGVLERLTAQPADVWHSGLKMGVAALPRVMDYVDPAWMYNKNAPADVEHTSFRLSFHCLLTRRKTLHIIKEAVTAFATPEMAGIAAGYALLKSGAVIRYTPAFMQTGAEAIQISTYDEWVFAKKFYSRKWHGWLQMTFPGFAKNILYNTRTAGVRPVNITPCLHRSEKIDKAVCKTVSVLAPTLDRYEYLKAELEQLSRQTVLPLEVLITDQTPPERRQRIDTAAYPIDIKVFEQQETGQCTAWNKLLEEARGEYVLFLGDDADEIQPEFIERLLGAMQRFNADMVASNVYEAGIANKKKQPYYYLSDTFPITLIKRSLLLQTGFMDMFYNRNIRADHDLAMRCHLQGALMIFNPSATIFHHRAPVGGLRTHKARAVTNYMVKHSYRFSIPTSSEIYLVKKFYSPAQFKSYIRIKFLNQLFIDGGAMRKVWKALLFIYKSPAIMKGYKKNLALANAAIDEGAAYNR